MEEVLSVRTLRVRRNLLALLIAFGLLLVGGDYLDFSKMKFLEIRITNAKNSTNVTFLMVALFVLNAFQLVQYWMLKSADEMKWTEALGVASKNRVGKIPTLDHLRKGHHGEEIVDWEYPDDGKYNYRNAKLQYSPTDKHIQWVVIAERKPIRSNQPWENTQVGAYEMLWSEFLPAQKMVRNHDWLNIAVIYYLIGTIATIPFIRWIVGSSLLPQ